LILKVKSYKLDDYIAYMKYTLSNLPKYWLIKFVSGIRSSGSRQKRGIATKVVFDRPFVFFVYNKLTGLIMLAGKITNPTQVPTTS